MYISIFKIVITLFFITCCSTSILNGNAPELFHTYEIEPDENLERILGFNEDSIDNFTVVTENYGYGSEAHTVVTDDDYILTMFRIPRGKNCTGPLKNTPILMMHGLLDSSDTWIIAGPGVGLAYILADQCYDVWCGNSRGNRYSRKHVKLNPDYDGAYWDFSFDQMGMYDLPAMVDYILENTGSGKLNYIGHSQGTAMFFILASTRIEYNDIINVAINLAPIAWVYNLDNLILRTLALALPEILLTAGLSGTKELFGHKQATAKLFQSLCQLVPQTVCGPLLLVGVGFNYKKTKTETIRAATGHFPSGTSLDNIARYVQGLTVDKFRRFDYGEQKNLEVYGTSEPPDYDVTKVCTQVVLVSGKNDCLSVSKDVDKLRQWLPNVVWDIVLEPFDWSHVDFVWGDRISDVMAPKVTYCLDRYG